MPVLSSFDINDTLAVEILDSCENISKGDIAMDGPESALAFLSVSHSFSPGFLLLRGSSLARFCLRFWRKRQVWKVIKRRVWKWISLKMDTYAAKKREPYTVTFTSSIKLVCIFLTSAADFVYGECRSWRNPPAQLHAQPLQYGALVSGLQVWSQMSARSVLIIRASTFSMVLLIAQSFLDRTDVA